MTTSIIHGEGENQMSAATAWKSSKHDSGLTLWTVDEAVTKESVLSWFETRGSELDGIIDQDGGVLIRGLNVIRDAADFQDVVALIGPVQHDYVGGTSPRTVVRPNVMTATDLPPRYSIPLHQEMAYTATPPDRISFFCETPADVDGETTVTDMRAVLRKIPPAFRASCEKHGLQLRRTIPSPQTAHLKPGVQKPWTEVFNTEDPVEAEKTVASRGWKASWYNGDTMHVWQDLLAPTRKHPVTGEDVWSNFAHFFSPICMMTWALEDGRVADYEELAQARKDNPEMLDRIFFGNGELAPEQECLDVFRILRQSEYAMMLQPGDIMVLDNMHFAHGRRSFSGPRRVLVSIFNRSARNAAPSGTIRLRARRRPARGRQG
jgi:alpha-ketoglutarate-dependent taurine dioxygenase